MIPFSLFATDFSGRLSLRYFNIDNRLNNDISAPALRLRMSAQNFLTPGMHFYFYYRGEKDLQGNRITRSRLYDMRLRADRLIGGMGIELGRINSSVVGAYGILDGISLKYQLSSSLSTGGFFGTEPDLLTYVMSDEIKRAGFFFQLDKGHTFQGTLSAIRQTFHNRLDRLYLYFDNDMKFSEQWSFSQFAEVDLKEKDDTGMVGHAFHFTNVFTDLRYAPSKMFNTTLSFNSRKEYRFLESMSDLPDSLFESAVSESYGLRCNLRPAQFWRIHASSRFGQRTDEPGLEKFMTMGLASNRFFSNNMFFNIRFARNWGFYANSASWYVSLERRLSNKLRLMSAFHRSVFQSQFNSLSSRYQSADIVLIYHFSWQLYGYLKATRSWGSDMNENRFFAELSYNLRHYGKKIEVSH